MMSRRNWFLVIVAVSIFHGTAFFAETSDMNNSIIPALDRTLTERERIDSLVNVVHDSPYTFVRNGKEYTGSRSAKWLAYKLFLYPKECQTVDDFIHKVASYSRRSGKEYYVIIEERHTISMKKFLLNALESAEREDERH